MLFKLSEADPRNIRKIVDALAAAFNGLTARFPMGNTDAIMGVHNFYKMVILDMENHHKAKEDFFRRLAVDTLAQGLGLKMRSLAPGEKFNAGAETLPSAIDAVAEKILDDIAPLVSAVGVFVDTPTEEAAEGLRQAYRSFVYIDGKGPTKEGAKAVQDFLKKRKEGQGEASTFSETELEEFAGDFDPSEA